MQVGRTPDAAPVHDVEAGFAQQPSPVARATTGNLLTLTRPSVSLKRGLLLTLGAATAATLVIRDRNGETAAVLKEAFVDLQPLSGTLDAQAMFAGMELAADGPESAPVVVHTQSPQVTQSAPKLLEQTTAALYEAGVRKFFVIGRDGFTPREIPLVNGVLRALDRAPGGVTLHARTDLKAHTDQMPGRGDPTMAQIDAQSVSAGRDADVIAASMEQINALCETLDCRGIRYSGWQSGDDRLRDMDKAIDRESGVAVIVVTPQEAMAAPCAERGWTLATPWNKEHPRAAFEEQPSAWTLAMHDGLARARRAGAAALVVRNSDLAEGGIDGEHFASFWRSQRYGVMDVPADDGEHLTVLVGADKLQPVRELAAHQPAVVFAEPAQTLTKIGTACGATVNLDRSKFLAVQIEQLFSLGVTKVFVGELHGSPNLAEVIARVLQGAIAGAGEPVHFFREQVDPWADDPTLVASDIVEMLQRDARILRNETSEPMGDALLMEVLADRNHLDMRVLNFWRNSQTHPMDEFVAVPGRAVASCGLSHVLGRISEVNLIEERWLPADDPYRFNPTENLVIGPEVQGEERARMVTAQKSMFEGLVRANAVTPTALVVNGGSASVSGQAERNALVDYCKELGFTVSWFAMADAAPGSEDVYVLLATPKAIEQERASRSAASRPAQGHAKWGL
ncbi:hypothetical protein [Caenimonas sp. SL110]|uniref:hypothetical protein n=1 Tax=Caenimonas sp. SL110 TaxID=1450524 RepID=UPI0006529CC6|nr:hypothetical protein [Caenimonas sp. SL110]